MGALYFAAEARQRQADVHRAQAAVRARSSASLGLGHQRCRMIRVHGRPLNLQNDETRQSEQRNC